MEEDNAMNMEKMNLNQYMQLIIVVMIGGTILANIGSTVGSDVWLLYTIAFVGGTLIYKVYTRILKLNDYKPFPQIFENCFGPLGRKVLTAVYAGFFMFRMNMNGDSLTGMASEILMRGAPRRLTVFVLLVGGIYACHKGLASMGRSVEIIFPIVFLALLPFFVTAFTSNAFSHRNLTPFLMEGIGELAKRTAAVTLFPYSETLVFCMMMPSIDYRERDALFKRGVMALLIVTLILIAISMANLAILGRHLIDSLKYPFYNAMMVAGIKGVLERLDPLAVIIIILCSFFKFAIYLYMSADFIASLSSRYKRSVVLVIIGVVVFIFVPQTRNLFTDKILTDILPFKLMPFFHLVLPGLLWGVSEYKFHKKERALKEKVSHQI